tara:strand:+ start:53 stop:220 length:168 start_codon:yes stop_codon:yes gene_type:complete
MNEQDWNAWCLSVVGRITKIEKTLKSYHKTQKRMLYMMGIGFVAVLLNGLLLFYK